MKGKNKEEKNNKKRQKYIPLRLEFGKKTNEELWEDSGNYSVHGILKLNLILWNV